MGILMFMDYMLYPDNLLPIEVGTMDIPASLFFNRPDSYYDNFPTHLDMKKRLKIDYELE